MLRYAYHFGRLMAHHFGRPTKMAHLYNLIYKIIHLQSYVYIYMYVYMYRYIIYIYIIYIYMYIDICFDTQPSQSILALVGCWHDIPHYFMHDGGHLARSQGKVIG
jgi:hypothetical protein